MEDLIIRIKNKINEGHTQIQSEYIKLGESVIEEIQKLLTEANEYVRKISILKGQYEVADKEVKNLLGRKELLEEKEKDIESRLTNVIQREDQADELMKILTNRQNILNEREKELQTKERRLS